MLAQHQYRGKKKAVVGPLPSHIQPPYAINTCVYFIIFWGSVWRKEPTKVYIKGNQHQFKLVLGSCKNQFVCFDLLQTLSSVVTHGTERQTPVNVRNRYSIKRLKVKTSVKVGSQEEKEQTGSVVGGWRGNKGDLRQGSELET